MNNENLDKYNFKICNNNTCIKNEDISLYNKKLKESICIPHGVNTDKKSDFDNLPENLNFNLCIDNTCLDNKKIKQFAQKTSKYKCIPDIESENNNIDFKICLGGVCLNTDYINEFTNKMYKYEDILEKSKIPIPSCEYNLNSIPSYLRPKNKKTTSTFKFKKSELENLNDLEKVLLENKIKYLYSQTLELKPKDININLSKGSIKIDVEINNQREAIKLPDDFRSKIIEDIKSLDISDIDTKNMSTIETRTELIDNKIDDEIFQEGIPLPFNIDDSFVTKNLEDSMEQGIPISYFGSSPGSVEKKKTK